MQHLPFVHNSTLGSKSCDINDWDFCLACFVHTSPSFEMQRFNRKNNNVKYLLSSTNSASSNTVCTIGIKSVKLNLVC